MLSNRSVEDVEGKTFQSSGAVDYPHKPERLVIIMKEVMGACELFCRQSQ